LRQLVNFGAGDGVSTFNVHDLRGRAVMGADSSNPLGQSQPDQNKSGFTTYYPSQGYKEGYITINKDYAKIVVNDDGSDTSKNTTASSGEDEARPKNVLMNWIIKY
jgi:microcystin-dependent protein